MNTAAIGLALAAAALFGLALVVTQRGFAYLDAWRGVAVAIPFSCLMFWTIAAFQLDASGWRWDAVLIFAAVGVVFPTSVTLLSYEGNRLMGPAITGAITNLSPVFAVIGAVALLGEIPSRLQLAALLLVVVGIVGMALSRGGGASWPLAALLLPLLAAGLRGVIQPAIKAGLALWPNPFAAVLFAYTISSAVVLTATAWRGTLVPRLYPPKGVAWFVVVGLCNSLAVLSMFAALARGDVILVSPLIATAPLFALVFGLPLLRARPNRRLIGGVIVTVAGVILLIAAPVLVAP